jgi:hypothetical protein
MFRHRHQCLLVYTFLPVVVQAVLRNGGAADVFSAGLVLLEMLLDIQCLYDHQRESEALTAYLSQVMAEDLSHKERCDRLASKLKALKMKRFETFSLLPSGLHLHLHLCSYPLSVVASGRRLCCWVRQLAPWRWTSYTSSRSTWSLLATLPRRLSHIPSSLVQLRDGSNRGLSSVGGCDFFFFFWFRFQMGIL